MRFITDTLLTITYQQIDRSLNHQTIIKCNETLYTIASQDLKYKPLNKSCIRFYLSTSAVLKMLREQQTKLLKKILSKPLIINFAENNEVHRLQIVDLYQVDIGCLVTFIKLKRKSSESSLLGEVMRLGNFLAVFIGLFGDCSQQRSVFQTLSSE